MQVDIDKWHILKLMANFQSKLEKYKLILYLL